MKKFLFDLLKFTPFAIIFYVLMVVLWGEVMPDRYKKNLIYNRGSFGHTLSRLTDASKSKQVDLLFLGASTCYRGFDTRYFESNDFTSFNLGSSSQTPIQTRQLLERYLDQMQPKLVVYEVYPETFQIDGVESTLDLLANSPIDYPITLATLQTFNAKTLNTYIYGSYRQFTGKNTNKHQSIRRENDTYIAHNGFVERDLTYYSYQHYTSQKWKLRTEQKAAFESLNQLLHKKHIPYLLVRAPLTTRLNDSYSNNKEFDTYIRQHGKYVDFNKELRLNDSLDFYDAVHLNQNGVKKFNSALMKHLTTF